MTLAAAARSEQRKLAVILDDVKAAPFHPGDLQERAAQGRVHEVAVVGRLARDLLAGPRGARGAGRALGADRGLKGAGFYVR